MKTRTLSVLLLILLFSGCEKGNKEMKKIIFLHHSTGWNIWLGKSNKYVYKLTGKNQIRDLFKEHNRKYNTDYIIDEQFFPKTVPYGWKNYPFDYYNIWVKHSGEKPYMKEPTLEILTREYDLIVFKHCYPGSNIMADTGNPDIESEEKRIENYRLQYLALKQKMHEFPNNKFIIWTPAVHVKNLISEDEAKRTQQFYEWVINEWDEKGDNIYIWDFYKYETEGGLYLLEKYAEGADNSHPNKEFSVRVGLLFSKFIIDVIQDKSE